jgi:hypothetical protein
MFPFTGACIVATGKENVSFSNSTLALSLFHFNFVLYLYSFDIKAVLLMEPASTFVIEENLSIKTFSFSDLLW